MTNKDKTKKIIENFNLFKRMGKKECVKCGGGITMNFFTIADQDIDTLVTRVLNIINSK